MAAGTFASNWDLHMQAVHPLNVLSVTALGASVLDHKRLRRAQTTLPLDKPTSKRVAAWSTEGAAGGRHTDALPRVRRRAEGGAPAGGAGGQGAEQQPDAEEPGARDALPAAPALAATLSLLLL